MARTKKDKVELPPADVSPPPSVPPELHEDWNTLIKSLPLVSLTAADVDTLERYFAHCLHWRQLQEIVSHQQRHYIYLLREREEATKEKTSIEERTFLGKQIVVAHDQHSKTLHDLTKTSAQVTSLARSLRLTRQSRIDPKTAGVEIVNNHTAQVAGTGQQSEQKMPWDKEWTPN